MNEPVLIVGQGLAGTLMSYQLRKRGISHFVLDNGNQFSASRIAAGMWNPVVFRRMNLSWKAHVVLNSLNSTYQDLEQILNKKLVHQKRILKIFPNEQFATLFKSRLDDPEFAGLLDLGKPNELLENPFSEFGHGVVHQGGYIDLTLLLDGWRNLLINENKFIENAFNYSSLDFGEEKVIYDSQTYSRIIFCEGHKIDENPWFSYLPMKHVKGEVLTINSTTPKYSDIINHNHFILPLSNGKYRVGATYDWENLDLNTSEEAKNLLISGLSAFLDPKLEIIDHKVGIRPSVADRRPLLGSHPNHPQLGILNGLGTKGVMLAPYCSGHLASFLFEHTPLDPEMDIRRWS